MGSGVLFHALYVTITHSQRHKKRILIVIHFNPSRSFFSVDRAGLKPMYPMQLHWAPRIWGPHAMVVGQVVHFCQVILALKNYRNGFLISMLKNSHLSKKRRYCSKELYQMCSILMLGRYVCAPACSSFYGWNLVVTGVR